MNRQACQALLSLMAGWLTLVFIMSAPPASAQGLDLPADGDERLMSCLTPARADASAIPYPANATRLRTEGTVRVRLLFADAASAPKVDILFATSDDFESAVRGYLDGYRLPCLPAGHSPVAAVQEFSFSIHGGEKVHWSPPMGTSTMVAGDGGCEALGFDRRTLGYPMTARTMPGTVTVLAGMRFDGPDQPPQVEVLNPLPHDFFGDEVKTWLSKVTLKCKGTRPWPVRAFQTYKFHLDGEKTAVLKDMPLQTFVGAIRDLPRHQVRFDLSSMSCPFEVQLHLHQPYALNSVGEVGKPDPNRAGFLAWLRTVSLRIPDETLNQVLGDTMRISVPCGVLDLTS